MRRVARGVLVSLATVTVVATVGSVAAAAPPGAYQRPGRTDIVLVASDGTRAREVFNPAAECIEYGGDISADGRYSVFHSAALNLAGRDLNPSPPQARRNVREDHPHIKHERSFRYCEPRQRLRPAVPPRRTFK